VRRENAVAIVDEGTMSMPRGRIAAKSNVPVGVVFEGGNQVIDPVARPNVFASLPRILGSRSGSRST
jgi:hypothetical protein